MFTTNAIIVMILVASFFIWGLNRTLLTNVMFSVSGTKGKKIPVKFTIIILFIFLLGMWIRDSYDIGFYRDAYVARISHGKEPLFDLICFFLYDRGVKFEEFKAVWFFVIAVLLYTGIQKYSNRPEEVAAICLITVTMSFISQMRSAMALAIMLNTFPLLFTGRIKDRVLYAISVIVCSMFHIVAFVYIIFLAVGLKKKRSFKTKYFIIIGAVTLFAIGMNAYFVKLIVMIAGVIPAFGSIANRIIVSIAGVGTPFKASLFLILEQVFLYLLTDRACRIQLDREWFDFRRYEVLREMNALSLIFIPICILNASFLRIYNPIAIIQYALILNVGYSRAGLTRNFTWSQSTKSLLIMFALFVFAVSIHSNPEDPLRMINSVQFY